MLAGLLTDDVLATPVITALSALQPESVAAVIENRGAWLDMATDTTRIRLALVRGFGWLPTTSATCESSLQRQGLQHASSLVRAAAALSMRDALTSPVLTALVHGVLSSDRLLALACRSRLQDIGHALFEPATKALGENSESDVYGNRHADEAGARRWLLLQVLQQTAMDTDHFQRLAAGISDDELAGGICRWNRPRIEILRRVMQHGNARVRLASIFAFDRLCAEEKVGCLTLLLGDIDRTVRRRAYRRLRRYLTTQKGTVSPGHVSLAAWWRSPRRCIQLLVLSTKMKR